jgi:hypothetical protein
MELKNALVHVGVCTPEDFGSLDIELIISDGLRELNSSSSRYFVRKNSLPLCSVKKVLTQGEYNHNEIIKTQEFYRKFENFTSPKIYGNYTSKAGYEYIVEEYIHAESLNEALIKKKIDKKQAEKILFNIHKEIYNHGSLSYSPSILQKEKNELLEAAKILLLPPEMLSTLSKTMDEEIDDLRTSLVRTTRDLNPKNILLPNNGKPVVVDFDLSRETHFYWLDVQRSNYYSQIELPVAYFLPGRQNINLSRLLFQLSEVYLQTKIVNKGRFLLEYGGRKKELLYLYDQVFQTSYCEDFKDLSIQEQVIELEGNDPPVKSSNCLQIFWNNTGSFSKDQSVIVPLTMNGQFQKYVVPLPVGSLKALRIDPGNQPSVVRIKQIEIHSTASDPAFVWDKSQRIKPIFNNVIPLAINDDIFLLSLDEDPQIILSELNIECNSNLELEIEVLVTNEFKEANDFINQILQNSSEDENTTSLDLLTILQDNLSLQTALAERDNSIKDLNKDLKLSQDQNTEMSYQLRRSQEEIEKLSSKLKIFEDTVNVMTNTLSWKVTKPLRFARSFYNKILNSKGDHL